MPGFEIDKESIKCFSSYLSDRTQKVIINDIVGNNIKINSGVPQGSVLVRFYL